MQPISLLNRILLSGSLAPITIVFSIGAVLNIYYDINLQVSLLFQSINNDAFRAAMYWVSCFNGDLLATIPVVIAGLLVWWRWGMFNAFFVIIAGLISWFNDALKVFFGLPRPAPGLVQIMAIEHSAAYPSGHAFFSVMLYGFLMFLALKKIKGQTRPLLPALFVLLILAVGASRVYLGVHWLSDVIGGYLFGGLFLSGLIWFYDIMANKYKKAAGMKL